MSLQIPEAVRQSWGDECVVEFVPWLELTIEEKAVPWLEQMVQEKAIPRDEYRQVLSRLDVLEHDTADIKEGIRELRSEMHDEIGGLRSEMRDEIGGLRTGMHDEIGGLRSEMRDEIGGLRAEMRGEIGGLRGEMNERFDRMNERFDQINERFVGMERHFEVRLDQMSERMLVQTRWLVGSIALFGTLITILMAIAQFTP